MTRSPMLDRIEAEDRDNWIAVLAEVVSLGIAIVGAFYLLTL